MMREMAGGYRHGRVRQQAPERRVRSGLSLVRIERAGALEQRGWMLQRGSAADPLMPPEV
jgi:hypothetical protein